MKVFLEEKGIQELINRKQSKLLFYTSNELITLLPQYHNIADADSWIRETGCYLNQFLPPVLYKILSSIEENQTHTKTHIQHDIQRLSFSNDEVKGHVLVLSEETYQLITTYNQAKRDGWQDNGFIEYHPGTELLSFNPACFQQLGYLPGELKENFKAFATITHPDDLPNFSNTIKANVPKNKAFCFTIRLLTKGKRYRWFEFSGKTIHVSGMDESLALISTKDVTPYQTQIEKLARENRQLKQSNLFRLHFLEKLSHAIRSPLNSISGFSGMILDEDFSFDEKREFANIIERNSENMVDMLRDFSETIRIESGDIELYKRFFDPHIILLNLFCKYESKRDLLKKEHIKIQLSIPEDAAVRVHADKSRFTQVFDQLIDNALKYTENGTIVFGYELKKEKLIFFVKDTGMGMNPDKQSAIFNLLNDTDVKNPFNQFKNGGTGLYISKHLIELMEGDIRVKSKLNVGTQFRFTLPYKKHKHKARPLQHISSQSGETYRWAGKKVLVVDDAKEIHHFIKLTLKNTSITCLYAESGQACIDLLNNISDIDVILLDIQMPEMNGISTIQKIHERKPDMPVIALTAHALGADETNLERHGFSDVIPKPIQRNVLFRSIRTVLK